MSNISSVIVTVNLYWFSLSVFSALPLTVVMMSPSSTIENDDPPKVNTVSSLPFKVYLAPHEDNHLPLYLHNYFYL